MNRDSRDLENKNIVVTGANRGIGKAIVSECMKNGANVWACMRTKNDEFEHFIQQSASENQVYAESLFFDMADEKAIVENANRILSCGIKIDGIINNAAVTGPIRLFTMTKMEEIKEVFQVNFFSPMLFTQRLLKNMIRNKEGSIVNITSVAAIDGEPGQFAYITSKAALAGATKKLSNELAQHQIRVNAVAPGMTDTDMIKAMKEDLKVNSLKGVSMKRLGKPSEIAAAVIFLLSDRSSFITGQVIRVDGGIR